MPQVRASTPRFSTILQSFFPGGPNFSPVLFVIHTTAFKPSGTKSPSRVSARRDFVCPFPKSRARELSIHTRLTRGVLTVRPGGGAPFSRPPVSPVLGG